MLQHGAFASGTAVPLVAPHTQSGSQGSGQSGAAGDGSGVNDLTQRLERLESMWASRSNGAGTRAAAVSRPATADAHAADAAAAAAAAKHPTMAHQPAGAQAPAYNTGHATAASAPNGQLDSSSSANGRPPKANRSRRSGRRRNSNNGRGANGSNSDDDEDATASSSFSSVSAGAQQMCDEALQRLQCEARWSPRSLAALDHAFAGIVQVRAVPCVHLSAAMQRRTRPSSCRCCSSLMDTSQRS